MQGEIVQLNTGYHGNLFIVKLVLIKKMRVLEKNISSQAWVENI